MNVARCSVAILLTFLLSGCTSIPDGIEPVKHFDLERYLGKWYEIARLDHSFERGLTRVTAEYKLLDDGGVKVLNRGYSEQDSEWREAEGKAYFVDSEEVGHLKVSFFGPFYGSYVVFELDEDYQYAFITGYDKTYLWLLSRSPKISDDLMQRFVSKAESLGFATDELIYVSQ